MGRGPARQPAPHADVEIVLNHFGGPLGVGPYERDEVFPGWRVDIKALSDRAPTAVATVTRRAGSQQTHRRREMDSNHRFRVNGAM